MTRLDIPLLEASGESSGDTPALPRRETALAGRVSADGPAPPPQISQEESAATATKSSATRLSINLLFDKLCRLTRQQVPCILAVSCDGLEKWHQGPIQDARRRDGKIELTGDGFQLQLREASLGLILQSYDRDLQLCNPLIEIFLRSGRVAARLYGLPEIGASVKWREVIELRLELPTRRARARISE